MNPLDKNDSDIVDSHLGLFRSPPEEQMSQAEERALRRLRSEPRHDAAQSSHRYHSGRAHGSRAHRNWAFALASAAALVLFVVLASWPSIRALLTSTDTAAVVEVADGALYDS